MVPLPAHKVAMIKQHIAQRVPQEHRELFLEQAIAQLRGEVVKKYKWYPVPVREFVESPQYLDKRKALYPVVMDALEELCSGKYVEAVLTGGIGSGKTTLALYATAYQLYLLSCLENPHESYGLDDDSEIIFIFQNINAKLAKEVSYNRFHSMIGGSPYFCEHYPFNTKTKLESKMVFPNRVEIIPLSGEETAAIGQNVMGGVIDELNYMAMTEKSKRTIDQTQYDQATALYNSIARRRKSRFQSKGKLPGILCLPSSKRYPGQFTDIKQEEAVTDPTIFVYDKRIWDIKPEAYEGEWFQVYTGNQFRKPRIIREGDTVTKQEEELLIEVPIDFKHEFEKDIINALREIAGVSTLAKSPYMTDSDKVSACFGTCESILTLSEVDMETTKPELLLDAIRYPEVERFIHEDLSISRDRTGLCCGHVKEFVQIKRGPEFETLPVIQIDFNLAVSPPPSGEIEYWKLRELIYNLRKNGLNIRWVTTDQYQSTDSRQILRQKGFITGLTSMDRTTAPYDMLKTALYDGRVLLPENNELLKELLGLEIDIKKGKVDHPTTGSKDIADALAGVVYGLSTRRSIWLQHNISPAQIPPSMTVEVKEDKHEGVL